MDVKDFDRCSPHQHLNVIAVFFHLSFASGHVPFAEIRCDYLSFASGHVPFAEILCVYLSFASGYIPFAEILCVYLSFRVWTRSIRSESLCLSLISRLDTFHSLRDIVLLLFAAFESIQLVIFLFSELWSWAIHRVFLLLESRIP